jgi:chromosome segregation ATPase
MPHTLSEHTQYVLERDRWEAGLERARRRPREEREQRRAESRQIASASDEFWAHVDARIEENGDVILEAVGEALGQSFDKQHASIQEALDRRDAEIKLLKREVGALRSEVELKLKLKSELAAARAEVEELRQRAPNFESALAELREQNARQEKVIRRLRGEQSTLEYQQRQLAAEQQKDRREVSLTAVRMTAFGQQTEKILRELYESGFNVVEEMQPLSRLSS